MNILLLYTSLFGLLVGIHCYVELSDDMKSFSHAQKNGHCIAGQEIAIFQRNESVPGVVTEQWFTGENCFNNASLIRYYIDGDVAPSIEGYLYMMHGIGFYNLTAATPWGTKWIGHLAAGGGLYNTMRVPYQKNILVTLQPIKSGFFWFILRGMENYPVVIGDVQLPTNARLKLDKIDKKTYPSFQFVTLASSAKNALLFMVNVAGESKDFNYLEGCFRTLEGNKTEPQYLSSGTEDFFMSAYYYNKGAYHTDHAGLTYFKLPGTMSAYKIFADDPVVLRNGFRLFWRISEVCRLLLFTNGFFFL